MHNLIDKMCRPGRSDHLKMGSRHPSAKVVFGLHEALTEIGRFGVQGFNRGHSKANGSRKPS